MLYRLDRQGPEAPEALTELALELARALDRAGQEGEAAALLRRVARIAPADPALGGALAARALELGNAELAVRALIPPWESGVPDPHLEGQLALATLLAGLHDAAAAIAAQPLTLTHQIVAALLQIRDGASAAEVMPLPGESAHWALILRGVARVTRRCGREDLLVPLGELAGALGVQLPSAEVERPPPSAARPPLACEARAPFEAAWGGPAPGVAFGWAWAAAQSTSPGARVLLAGPWAQALAILFPHTRSVQIGPTPPGPGGPTGSAGRYLRCEPGRLPLGFGRFDRVIAAGWLEQGAAPLEALRELRRVCAPQGELHLLGLGPGAEGSDPLRLAPTACRALCEVAGLYVSTLRCRSARGRATNPSRAAVYLLRGGKTLL